MTGSEGLDIASMFEGQELLDLYSRNPDPAFPPESIGAASGALVLFHGRIKLGEWLNSPVPLPSAPITFWGSPVTDVFPLGQAGPGAVREAVKAAGKKGSWALVVKDLPVGAPIEGALIEEGFAPVEHDPIWYTRAVPVDEFLRGLSKGRRRGLEGRWRKFRCLVHARVATPDDAAFLKKSYNTVRGRSGMRLEELSAGFFMAAASHPSCRVIVFEKDGAPFAFSMVWKNGGVWFDKYIGTDDKVYREMSFYSMSILYLLEEAHASGARWYVAGQGCGADKEGLGLSRVDVRLWIKPLLFRSVLSPLLKRFMKAHSRRVYGGQGQDVRS